MSGNQCSFTPAGPQPAERALRLLEGPLAADRVTARLQRFQDGPVVVQTAGARVGPVLPPGARRTSRARRNRRNRSPASHRRSPDSCSTRSSPAAAPGQHVKAGGRRRSIGLRGRVWRTRLLIDRMVILGRSGNQGIDVSCTHVILCGSSGSIACVQARTLQDSSPHTRSQLP